MKVIGFNLTKISIERKEKAPENIQVSQNINIKDVSKEKISISENEALKIEFNFIINYTENFAKLEFDGNVMLLPEKDELKNFLKNWKDKKIPDQDKAPLFNFIMNKCNIKALDLEDELGLPFHIPMPRMNPGKQD